MNTYTLQLTLNSPTLIGSGEGFGALIDTDIVFDDVGIPLVPAKRIKGCLRDAALDVQEMFACAKIDFPIQIEQTFGRPGDMQSAPVYFSNLTIEQYQQNHLWLSYLLQTDQYPDILSRDRILDTFTEIRQQTAIDEDSGVADDHSLRTIRVVKKGLSFYGQIQVEDADPDKAIQHTLLLACLNLRVLGTKRNRGFGEVHCALYAQNKPISIPKKLEELCTHSDIV